MDWNLDSITVSVKDCGNYIQIAKPEMTASSCKINLKPEQVDKLNQWLLEAREKAIELQESVINMVSEGGPA